MAESTPQQTSTVTIDGTQYEREALSDNAQAQLTNLQITDREIARLEQQLAIARTARAAYARALSSELPQPQSGQQH